ncbi:MAG: hypothetical protein R3Y54_05585 [Eubacteriales bacterium]
MNDSVIDLLKELGSFTILAQTLVHFSASKKFEKHIRLFIASVTLVIILTPIVDVILLVKGEQANHFANQVEKMMESYWNGDTLLYEMDSYEEWDKEFSQDKTWYDIDGKQRIDEIVIDSIKVN